MQRLLTKWHRNCRVSSAFRDLRNPPESRKNRRSQVRSFRFLLLFFGLAVMSVPAFAGRGEAIIRRVQEKFESLETLSVHFEMRYQTGQAGGVESQEGMIFLDGQGRFKTETPQETVVSDGKTIWMYNALENQVIVRSNADAAGDMLTPQMLMVQYPSRYTVEKVEEATFSDRLCDVLVMVPKDETDPTRVLKVWIDRKENLTRKLFLEDLAGNATTFEFEAFQLGQKLPAETFQFVPPEGAEVIDLR